jgi:hypothetical protein
MLLMPALFAASFKALSVVKNLSQFIDLEVAICNASAM